jgi:hypothetical protein
MIEISMPETLGEFFEEAMTEAGHMLGQVWSCTGTGAGSTETASEACSLSRYAS